MYCYILFWKRFILERKGDEKVASCRQAYIRFNLQLNISSKVFEIERFLLYLKEASRKVKVRTVPTYEMAGLILFFVLKWRQRIWHALTESLPRSRGHVICSSQYKEFDESEVFFKIFTSDLYAMSFSRTGEWRMNYILSVEGKSSVSKK